MNDQALEEHLVFAKELALEAGAIIKANFTLGMMRELKEDTTPVTETDTRINKMVIEKIQQTYPAYGVIGEEESYETGRSMLWTCDPIDGTIPFSSGIPVSTFAMALILEGQPAVAVAYDPYMDRLFAARKGGGARLNGQPIHVNQETKLENGYVSISRQLLHRNVTIGQFLDRLGELHVKPFGLLSFIYAGALVSAGEMVAAMAAGGKIWDVAPIKLLVEEAGGKATDMFGKDRVYDQEGAGLIATNGLVHDEFLELLQ